MFKNYGLSGRFYNHFQIPGGHVRARIQLFEPDKSSQTLPVAPAASHRQISQSTISGKKAAAAAMTTTTTVKEWSTPMRTTVVGEQPKAVGDSAGIGYFLLQGITTSTTELRSVKTDYNVITPAYKSALGVSCPINRSSYSHASLMIAISTRTMSNYDFAFVY